MKKLLLILLLSPLLSFGQMFGTLGYYYVSGSVAPASNEWNIEIQASQCGTAVSDTFTVLVKLQSDSLKPTYKGGLTACLTGNDIRFYTTDTNTLLNWAKERYDPDSGIVIMWVKIYSVSNSSNTTFKMDCGRTTDTSTFKGGATGTAWKSTVQAAFFMNDATGANLTDNSAYGNTMTQTNSPALSNGQIGYASGMTSTSNQYYTANMNALNSISKGSMLFLGKRNASTSHVIMGKHSGGEAFVGYVYGDGVIYFQVNTTGSAYGYVTNSGTSWHNYALVFDGTASGNSNRCKIYINGAAQSLSFIGTIPATTPATAGVFRIGKDGTLADQQTGLTDMTLIYTDAVSSSWVTTIYNNWNSPGNLGSAGFLRFYH